MKPGSRGPGQPECSIRHRGWPSRRGLRAGPNAASALDPRTRASSHRDVDRSRSAYPLHASEHEPLRGPSGASLGPTDLTASVARRAPPCPGTCPGFGPFPSRIGVAPRIHLGGEGLPGSGFGVQGRRSKDRGPGIVNRSSEIGVRGSESGNRSPRPRGAHRGPVVSSPPRSSPRDSSLPALTTIVRRQRASVVRDVGYAPKSSITRSALPRRCSRSSSRWSPMWPMRKVFPLRSP